jgi:hypothetical protein
MKSYFRRSALEKKKLGNNESDKHSTCQTLVHNRKHTYPAVYALDNRGIAVRFSLGTRDFSLFQIVQTDSAVHPAHLSRGTGGSCPGSKAGSRGTHRLQQRSRLTSTKLNIYSPIRLHGLYNKYTCTLPLSTPP